MGALTKGLMVVAVLATLALHQADARGGEPATVAAPAVESVGRGRLERAACIGCAITVVAAGGATWGGLAILAGMFPEPILACGFICVVAWAT